jgi:ubiquinone biosynthesis monooxygenase Coq7
MDAMDRLIAGLDTALRTLSGVHRARRASPAEGISDTAQDARQRPYAAALMRVNHAGEVCAQALYQGHALTARDLVSREALMQAAREEEDHLAWSAARVRELGGHLSLLNPVWYAGSLVIGAAAGALGDRWSLAFLAETERQVEEHLTGHLAALSTEDLRSRAVIEAMRADEVRHRDDAIGLGAAELPEPVKKGMRVMAKIMTTLAHRV